jgi:hypothetical protein
VIERLIENWLTSAGERGYEVPFAQLLAAEGHRVIQGPVHHPFEHGKDILTFAPDGALHAYQLKGPDLVRLEDFEKIQGQLMALAGTAITHAAVTLVSVSMCSGLSIRRTLGRSVVTSLPSLL